MGSKTNKKLEKKDELLEQVMLLVPKGVLSPTVIMQELSEIKSWQTSKKYIKLAKRRLQKYVEELTSKPEYKAMINHLYYVRSKLMKLFKSNTNLNQLVGLAKQISKINEQLIRLLDLDEFSAENYYFKKETRRKGLTTELHKLENLADRLKVFN